MFDNNFGKCGPIFKILYQVIHKKILYVHYTKISTFTSSQHLLIVCPMLCMDRI